MIGENYGRKKRRICRKLQPYMNTHEAMYHFSFFVCKFGFNFVISYCSTVQRVLILISNMVIVFFFNNLIVMSLMLYLGLVYQTYQVISTEFCI